MRSNALLALGVLLLSACVSAPDVEVCTNLSATVGWCTKTISGGSVMVDSKNQKLNGQLWPDVVNSSVIVPATSWVVIKQFIENTCHQSGNCQNGVGSWQTTVDNIDTHVTLMKKKGK